MFSRFLVVGLASLALACGIALVFYKVVGVSSERKKTKMRNVVVATADLPVGARIRPQEIRVVAVPDELAPQNCFEKLEDVKDRVVINVVMKDEPVVLTRLAPPGSAPGLAPMIPAGFRAVSVRVNDVIGVAGFIQPGMRVDVLASGRLPNSEDSVTRTVLQNVTVLSAGQLLQPEAKGQVINAQVVTLQVRPDEAEILALTSGEGKIQLVLRNSSDTDVAPTHGANLKTVYSVGGVAVPPIVNRRYDKPPGTLKPPVEIASPVTVPTTPRTVEVIRGTTRSDVTTQDGTEKKSGTEKRKVTERRHAPYIFV